MMDRRRRRHNRLKSALGRSRVSQSEDLRRCRFSLSHAIHADPFGERFDDALFHQRQVGFSSWAAGSLF